MRPGASVGGTYGLRAPASHAYCAYRLRVPEAQGGLPRVLYAQATRTSHGRAVRTAHRAPPAAQVGFLSPQARGGGEAPTDAPPERASRPRRFVPRRARSRELRRPRYSPRRAPRARPPARAARRRPPRAPAASADAPRVRVRHALPRAREQRRAGRRALRVRGSDPTLALAQPSPGPSPSPKPRPNSGPNSGPNARGGARPHSAQPLAASGPFASAQSRAAALETVARAARRARKQARAEALAHAALPRSARHARTTHARTPVSTRPTPPGVYPQALTRGELERRHAHGCNSRCAHCHVRLPRPSARCDACQGR